MQAYTEIRDAGYFYEENDLWQKIMDSKTESSDERNELLAKVYIKPEPVAVYRAVLFHEGADKPNPAASNPPSVMETKGFGAPVTHEILKAMSHYSGKTITRFHKAQEALKDMYGEGKEVALLEHVKELMPKIGNKSATICMVYNATGEPLEYVTHHNWSGVLQGSTHYPKEIPNGQWAAFVHATSYQAFGSLMAPSSHGAVVYRCKNAYGVESDWMFSWINSYSKKHERKAYTEIRDVGNFYEENDLWEEFGGFTMDSKTESSDEGNGLLAKVYIKPETVAVYRAVIFLEGADKPDA